MQSGYYGYRRRRRSPFFIIVAVLILLAGAAGYWFLNSSSGGQEGTSGKEVRSAEMAPEPDIDDLILRKDCEESNYWLLVDKSNFEIYLYKGSKLEKRYPVAVGLVSGDKEEPGDNKTPEGTFTVKSLEDSRHWVYDFGDGKGPIEGAFGPWFIRLETGWEGIGIHGTHDPGSMGTRCTAGCIRMENEALLDVVSIIDEGSTVIIRD